MIKTEYTEEDDFSALLVGRRVVAAETGVDRPDGWWIHDVGLLTLDDGTRIYVGGNEGCGGCPSGYYSIAHLARVDNVITSVRVVANTTDDYSPEDEGHYEIFVVAEAEELSLARFEGTDGNGYYGTGFRLMVAPAEADHA